MEKTSKFYMDGVLRSNLTMAKNVIKSDWDMVFIVDGAEGSGKSVLAMQSASYCDPTFNIDRITFTPEEFRSAIINADKYQSVIFDEAYRGLSSRAAMTMVNRSLIQMLAEIRQKNLFVFVVMPSFFDLDKYVALWRSRALIHVYIGDNFQRGFFMFFNAERKKDLYITGKKYYSYSKPKSNFFGRFTNYYPIDEQRYRKKKKDALVDNEMNDNKVQRFSDIEINLFNNEDLTIKQKAMVMGVTEKTYYNRLNRYRDDLLRN